MAIIINIFLAIIFVASFSSCSDQELMYKIENQSSQEKLIIELKEKNIPIRMGEDREVWFPPKYFDTVDEIARSVMKSVPDSTSFSYVEVEYTDLLIKKLKENDIPFNTKYRNSVKFVTLSNEYEQQWAPLENEVANLLADKKIKELKNND